MERYKIKTMEIGGTENASVVATNGKTIYEDPDHSDIPCDDAEKAAVSIAGSGLADAVIEQKWILVSCDAE